MVIHLGKESIPGGGWAPEASAGVWSLTKNQGLGGSVAELLAQHLCPVAIDPTIITDLLLSSTNMAANSDLSGIWEPEDSGLLYQNSRRACGNMARSHPRGSACHHRGFI